MVSATIDAGALRHNLNVVRQWAPKSRVMAVIKANAYGHGLVAVARALESADAFAVARVDEGLTLRAAGINTPTVLLEGVFDREQLDAAAGANFELVVHTAEQIELLRTAAAAEDSLAAILARSIFGIAIAAIIRMIATTISNSISENPFSFNAVFRKVNSGPSTRSLQSL